MTATAGDSAAASVYVAVSLDDAFDVFTSEIDLWWRHGVRYRIAGKRPGKLVFETKLGGRLFETVGDHTFVVGSVVEWAPPRRLALEWRNVNFAAHEKTLVEVTFTPQGEGTMVRVVHRGWSTIRPDHPARHGQDVVAFLRSMGMWWGDLLTALREHAGSRSTPPSEPA
jgi:uncharacterized protein YndB with AHSA1/START domain